MKNVDLLSGLPGFRDYYPEDWREISFILDQMRMISLKYGYEEYEGPTIERVELIEAKSGEELIKEIFQLKDRYDNRLLLRPEQTPTLARMLAKEQQRFKRPIRWFSIPRLFRDETVQKGRVREFWQLNVDILGENRVSADAEIIAVAIDIIRACGLNDNQFYVYVNHRDLLNNFIKTLGYLNPQKIIPIIDKRDSLIQEYMKQELLKEGKSEKEADEISLLIRRIVNSSSDFKEKLLKEAAGYIGYLDNYEEIEGIVMMNAYSEQGLTEDQSEKLFKLTSIKAEPKEFVNKLKSLNLPPECDEAINQFELLSIYLEGFGVSKPVMFNSSLARGLDYYTGIVFEAFDSTGEIVRAILGGGRYADLVQSLGGSELSGVGFGMGELVILELIKLNNAIPNIESSIDLYLAPIKKESIPFILQLSRRLQTEFKVLCNPFNWKMKRHFEQSDLKNAKFVILAGPKDIENGVVSIRRVKDGQNFTLEVNENLEYELRKILTD